MLFIILNMNCILGFRKMTFKIHLIFTSLAGIIFRPLFSTFCSCYKFYTLSRKSHYFFMLSTWYCSWCLMNFFFEKNVFSHPLQLPVHFLACYSTNSVIFLLKNIHFSQSMHVIAQDVSSLLPKVFSYFPHVVLFEDCWISLTKKKFYCINCNFVLRIRFVLRLFFRSLSEKEIDIQCEKQTHYRIGWWSISSSWMFS